MNLLFQTFKPCIPPTATKQQKFPVKMANKIVMVHPPKVKKAIEYVKGMFMPDCFTELYDGPVYVEMMLVYPWRKTETKRDKAKGRIWIPTRPDLDNLCKLIMDSVAPFFLADDSQICWEEHIKLRGENPGIGFSLHSLNSRDIATASGTFREHYQMPEQLFDDQPGGKEKK